MYNQNEPQGHRLRVAGKAFKMLPGLLERAGIGFSGRHNAVYGMADFVRVLVSMCRDRACASGATGTLAVRHGPRRVPSSAWVLSRIRGACPEPDAMRERCAGALASTVRDAGRSRILRRIRCVVALDYHLIPRYDRDPATREEQLVRARHRSGTSRFEGYATAQMVDGPGLNLACRPKGGSTGAGIVRELLRDCAGVGVRPRLVLLDRGFFSAGVVGELSGSGHRFIMPASRTAGIKRAVGEHARGERAAVSPHALTPQDRKASEPFTLVIVPKKEGEDGWDSGDAQERYLAYATNADAGRAVRAADVPDEYRKRWGIETGYRDAEKARPRTTSPDASVRTFLFFMALVMYNLWMMSVEWSAGWYGSRDTASIRLAVMLECMVGMAAGGTDGCRAWPNQSSGG